MDELDLKQILDKVNCFMKNTSLERFITPWNIANSKVLNDSGLVIFSHDEKPVETAEHEYHKYLEVGLCLEGISDFYINGEFIRLLPGQSIAIPSNTRHAYAGSGRSIKGTFRHVWFFFGKITTMHMFECRPGRKGVSGQLSLSKLLVPNIFMGGMDLSSEIKGTDTKVLYTYSCVTGAIAQFLDAAVHNPAGRNMVLTEEILSQLMAYIEENYQRDIPLYEISDMANLSPTYFSHVFKKYAGVPFTEYLVSIRVNKARELLAMGMRISDIANAVGYEDPFYFSKVFKKITGKSPLAYRNSIGC